MLTVPNRASEDFLAAFDFAATSLESLAVYGNKPNAIVRPLQHSKDVAATKDGLVITDLEAQIVPNAPLDLRINGRRIGSEVVDDEELNKEEFFSRQLDQKLRLYDFGKDYSRNVGPFSIFCIKMDFKRGFLCKNREHHHNRISIRNPYSLPRYLEAFFFNQRKHFRHFRKK